LPGLLSTDDLGTRRQRLAGVLTQLRLDAQLSARELGEAFDWSQSKVSKIENGRTGPAVADVRRWLDHPAINTTAEQRSELLELAADISTQAKAWREVNEQAFDQQQNRRAERDTEADGFAFFQSEVVPGLLQTPEYARRVLEVQSQVPAAGLPAAVLARLNRQAVLFDESKQLDFVITEAALRWRPGTISVTLAQLDRVASVASLPNVSVGVVPWPAQAIAKPLHSFVIVRYPDAPEVQVETLTAELTITEPDDVALYEEMFQHQRSHAVYDAQLDELLKTIAAGLRAVRTPT
jgi:transcriptional regulator with XRE-family HTH domain